MRQDFLNRGHIIFHFLGFVRSIDKQLLHLILTKLYSLTWFEQGYLSGNEKFLADGRRYGQNR